MRKYICFLCLLISSAFAVTGLFAQDNSLQGLHFGAFLGPNYSFPQTDFDAPALNRDYSGRVGINGGIILDYGFSQYIGGQSGIQISTRGFKITSMVEDPGDPSPDLIELTSIQNFTVISVPILFRVRPGSPVSRFSGFFLAGFVPDIQVSYRSKFDRLQIDVDGNGIVTTTIVPEEKTSREFVNTFSGSLRFGAGFMANRAVIQGSYNLGLFNILDEPDMEVGQAKTKVNYLTFVVGYFF